MELAEKVMKQIVPGSQHAVIVKRATDGLVGLFFTVDPRAWLTALSAHMELEDAEVRASVHAPRLVSFLRARFSHAHQPGDAMAWYLIDFPQAVNALEDFDMSSGELLGHLKPNTEVWVLPQRVRGTVIGFGKCGRVTVRLHGTRYTENLILALRENLKPVLRVAALSGPLT
jgi:hypothetical protein